MIYSEVPLYFLAVIFALFLLFVCPAFDIKDYNADKREEKEVKNAFKIALTALLGVNILLMIPAWFGGMKGVQELRGLIILTNPVMILSIVCILLGLWLKPLKKLLYWLLYGGMLGMMGAEIYEFFTWYTHTISVRSGVIKSFNMAQPMFFVGFMFTVAMLTTAVLLGYCQYKTDEKNLQQGAA